MILNGDKFGYYKSNNIITYSKYEAFENGNPEWIFNDDIFSDFISYGFILLVEVY